jgi:hypothetical protein
MTIPYTDLRSFSLLAFLFFYIPVLSYSQVVNPGMQEDTSGGERIGNLKIEGYIDAYGSYYPKKFQFDQDRNYFLVNHNMNNQFNINLAFAKLSYQSENVRARITPAFGSYMVANYGMYSISNLMEANVGFRVYKKIWVDAGILPAPFSNESPISKDHLMYTRSLAAELVPYYMTGARLEVPINLKLNWYFYVVNNWQSIADNNRLKSFASQLEYRPNKNHLVNWNVYYGNDGQMDFGNRVVDSHRWFSDLYWVYQPEGRFSFTTCVWAEFIKDEFSYGMGNRTLSGQANFIGRYQLNKKHSVSGRIEYFQRERLLKEDQLYRMGASGLASAGLCWNVAVAKNALFRVEARQFLAPEKVDRMENDFPTATFGTWLICGATVSY